MKKIVFLAFCFWIIVLPGQAFKKIFADSKKAKTKILLKDSFLVEKNIVLAGELDTLRLGYATAPELDEILISVVYDELLQKPITNITWQTQELKNSKVPARNTQSFKTQQTILKQMEEMAQGLDPNSAYDRIINDKHLIKKDFFFRKSEIFDMSKTLEEKKQILEINFLSKDTKLVFPLDISDLVYFRQSAPAPQKPQKQALIPDTKKSKSTNSEFSPNFGRSKVPGYLFPQGREAPAQNQAQTQTQNRSPSQAEINQMLELKELEEARSKVQGMNEFYQTQMQSPVQEEKIPAELQMLMQEESGAEDQDLF
jgi:hypothetical protein